MKIKRILFKKTDILHKKEIEELAESTKANQALRNFVSTLVVTAIL
jgi:hypothetical protein